MGGESLRTAAKLRAYTATGKHDCFKTHCITCGLLEVIKMHLVLGFGYLFRRLKHGPFRRKEGLCQ
jgi:hypothetical protein